MKVYHLQAGMAPAGNAAYRLHIAMREAGIDSEIITLFSIKSLYKISTIKKSFFYYFSKVSNILLNKYRYRGLIKGSYLFSALPVFRMTEVEKWLKDADAIYIHWIGGNLLSASDLNKILSTGKKTILFLHDMWGITGGCHHSFDCEKYQSGCADCPMFKHNNIANKQADIKRKIFSKFDNLTIVAPSRWMKEKAEKSYITKGLKVIHIDNYIDENIFKPVDKIAARKFLGLPSDKFIISFGCQSGTKNEFKGWKYLKEAINNTNLDNVLLLVFGNDYDDNTVADLKYPVKFTGQVMDEFSLPLIANACDLHVSPSLAESFGMTFIENALCGTPVIGFDCTAVPEAVNSSTGLLAKYKDSRDLSRCIQYIYDNGFNPQIRSYYSSKSILNKHLDLLKSKV